MTKEKENVLWKKMGKIIRQGRGKIGERKGNIKKYRKEKTKKIVKEETRKGKKIMRNKESRPRKGKIKQEENEGK